MKDVQGQPKAPIITPARYRRCLLSPLIRLSSLLFSRLFRYDLYSTQLVPVCSYVVLFPIEKSSWLYFDTTKTRSPSKEGRYPRRLLRVLSAVYANLSIGLLFSPFFAPIEPCVFAFFVVEIAVHLLFIRATSWCTASHLQQLVMVYS